MVKHVEQVEFSNLKSHVHSPNYQMYSLVRFQSPSLHPSEVSRTEIDSYDCFGLQSTWSHCNIWLLSQQRIGFLSLEIELSDQNAEMGKGHEEAPKWLLNSILNWCSYLLYTRNLVNLVCKSTFTMMLLHSYFLKTPSKDSLKTRHSDSYL
jgi:hypothetical protein